jgi:hypothetical protein
MYEFLGDWIVLSLVEKEAKKAAKAAKFEAKKEKQVYQVRFVSNWVIEGCCCTRDGFQEI